MNRTRNVFLLSYVVWLVAIPTALTTGAAELLQSTGQYIRLTSDLPADETDTLVASFDAAVPQWIEFWNLPADSLANWKVDACVMRDKNAFEREGWIPKNVPDFPYGYALGSRIWVLAQDSEYYTRHLLLHEGVHSLAFEQFGGAGPTWFMEGSAELLATHRGQGADIQVNWVPSDRDSVPYWGRFKLMSQLRQQGKLPQIDQVMRYQPSLQGNVEVYGWSWAASMLLHSYPEYRDAFQKAARNGRDVGAGFNRKLYESLRKDWPVIAARWRLMCRDLDYGFDWQREQTQISAADSVWDGQPISTKVVADQGWQSTGVLFQPGAQLSLLPSGQITVAQTTKPWTSQPAGITIEYRSGLPLGQLQMCILPTKTKPDSKNTLEVRAVTEATSFTVPEFCWLLFRVNDGVGELADNQGAYEVSISVDAH
ncbi:MAG: hypothetical protein AB8B91_16035 [Rubripirellula sp.]